MDVVEVVPPEYPTNLIAKDWSKRKCFYMPGTQPFIDLVHKMEVFDDDVWVVTMPKCGTTWMQELVWLVMHDYNFEAAKAEHLELRSPFLSFDFMLHKDLTRALKPVEELQRPRLIKTHSALPLLPKQLWQKKPKVVYVIRNPKDAFVSQYYHLVGIGRAPEGSVEDYVRGVVEHEHKLNLFIEHAVEFYQLRHEPWIFYTSFERMKSDLAGVLRDVCKFLDKPINEQQMQAMLHHLSFEEMKKNPTVNHAWEAAEHAKLLQVESKPFQFVRKGQVDGYKDDLSAELIAKADRLIAEKLAAHNLTLNELLLLDAKKTS